MNSILFQIGYSSNLLADFVEKTELLSRGTSSSTTGGARGSDNAPGSSCTGESSASKRKRGRPPKNNVKSKFTGTEEEVLQFIQSFYAY